ncbi:Glycerol-3-phosphate acyltransferase [Dissostichus eleginoides]|uniref:Glycerol-3-phosphate acyltransferase n=1 Tax=Dissostichus eleginoides TaxID=100907 RepID=A0AAD9ESM9_DISEL|nr:Glycerol-3-phosphate acyltransferase [Dissostichus eleginoides]
MSRNLSETERVHIDLQGRFSTFFWTARDTLRSAQRPFSPSLLINAINLLASKSPKRDVKSANTMKADNVRESCDSKSTKIPRKQQIFRKVNKKKKHCG